MKILLGIFRIIFILAFLYISVFMIPALYEIGRDYFAQKTWQKKVEIEKTKCTVENPLFDYNEISCVPCDYPKSVKVGKEGELNNPCPNRKIVYDVGCSENDVYSILSSKLGDWSPTWCVSGKNLRGFLVCRLVSMFAFYIFVICGLLWSFKKLKARWMLVSFSVFLIVWRISEFVIVKFFK